MSDKFERNWYVLKKFFIDYREEKSKGCTDRRYCVALSIDDILKKMNEIEEKMWAICTF